MKKFFIALLAGTVCFSACKKDDDLQAVKGDSGVVTYEVRGDDDLVVFPGMTFDWVEGYGTVTELKFKAKSDDTKVEYKSTANQTFDLFSPGTAIGNIILPPGDYEKIEFKMKLAPSFQSHALYLEGVLDDNGTIIPIVFVVDDEIEFKMEHKDVLLVDEDDYIALFSVPLANLLNGITPSMLQNAVLTNGTLLISEDVNRDIYQTILSNLDRNVKGECKKK